MSSIVTIIFGYIAAVLFLVVFFHYKCLKILDICTLFCMRQIPTAAAALKSAAPNGAAAATAAATAAYVSVKPDRVRTIWDIPGPAVVPMLGTKWIFLWRYSMTQMHKVYAEFAQLYGPIVLEVMPSGVPIVLLFDRADIEKVLRYPSRYPFRPPTEIVSTYRNSRPDRYASVGITNEQGVAWNHLRSRLTPAITSPRVLNAFLPALNEICDDFVQLLRAKRCPQSAVVPDFLEVANLMGLEAVCTLMLGKRMGFLSAEPSADVIALAGAVKRLFIAQRDSTYGLGMWRYWRTRTWRDFTASEELVYTIVSDIVDRAIAETRNDELNGCAADAGDTARSVFLSILNDPQLDVREKKSAIIDFISAGIETLANTLAFVLYYATREAKTQLAILAEFPVAAAGGRPVDVNDLAAAVYTKACVQETYRLSPTAFCLARILEEDTQLSGYDLKAGSVVLCQSMHACNNEANFTNASQFRPDRWLQRGAAARCSSTEVADAAAESDAAHLVVPFGIGRRTCPGRRFVEMELTVLLAKLVQQFEIDYCGELQTEFEFLLVPRGPVGLRLRDRSATAPPAMPAGP